MLLKLGPRTHPVLSLIHVTVKGTCCMQAKLTSELCQSFIFDCKKQSFKYSPVSPLPHTAQVLTSNHSDTNLLLNSTNTYFYLPSFFLFILLRKDPSDMTLFEEQKRGRERI